MPGISAAGITNVLPASGFQGGSAYVLDETAHDAASGQLRIAPWSNIEGNYFQAMGIRLIQGRTLNADDKEGTPLVAVVNQKLANHFWPNGDVIGRRLRVGTPQTKTPWVTIVGVVETTKMNALDAPDHEQVYVSSPQFLSMLGPFAPKDQSGFGGFIVLRSTLPPEQMTNSLRSAVAALDPLLALQQIQTMDQQLSTSEAPRRFNTSIITAFAAGALLLATIGVYAVIAFSVSMRSQEMAIRMALGSRRGEIVRLVLVSGAKLAAIGCAAGLIGALAVSKLLGSLLFNVSATDPLILTSSIAIMIVLSLVACAIPAQRAASANPVDALRSE
jgi:predicted permease